MRARWLREALLLVLAIGAVLAVDFPIAWMPLSSIKEFGDLFSSPPRIVPREITFRHYITLFERTGFGTYFVNSTVVALATVALSLLLSLPAAYALTRYRFPGREAYARFALLAYMFPPVFLAIPLFVILVRMRLGNSYVGLVLTHMTFALPFSIWLLRAFFRAVPLELEEAAWVDGATQLQGVWHVVLPLSFAGVMATAIFTAVLSWNDYLFAAILMTTEGKKTLPLAVALLTSEASSTEWGVIMAAGVLVTIPAVALFAGMHRYVVQGIGVGALKE